MNLSRESTSKTNWFSVYLLIGAGVVCAFQIGKAPPALTLIRNELGLDLVFSGWIIGIYALFAAIVGIFGGAFADTAGYRRSLLFGLCSIAFGSFSGAFAPNGQILLISRFVEAIGYLPIVVSVPALLGQVTATEGDRRLAAGIWGAYMPAGTAAMMLAAPLFLADQDFGWRGLWLINGAIAGAYALGLALLIPTLGTRRETGLTKVTPLKDACSILKTPGSLLLGLFFATYAGNYLTVYGFLPTMLIEDLGVAPALAALLSALAVAINICGNIFGGWLRKKNVSFAKIIFFGSLFTGLTSFGIFSEFLGFEMRYVMAVLYSAFCGVIPGATWSAAASLVPKTRLVGTAIGWVVQGGNIGTLALPPLAAIVVATYSGWYAASFVVAGSSLLGAGLALLIARFASEKTQTG